ncbi:hypothetical protein ACO22_03784 [Paracoccidioides brasiliensis]|uniref:Uncharacterized protein n=1 Tax=Paracoccidioides brasiliensis TaxID=121759 RepID=A0A1D2JF37_PARBR|nr:hypothetical protein ACO22_03784 [Paracoccidioides brasiliensis]ODH46058.1 hypothetical protein GX48_07856 [Paracoccidioides brasiliensis]
MSYALATKKRKFHRVLDSLSGANAQKPPHADSSISTTNDNVPPTAPLSAEIKYPTIKKVRLASSSSVPDSQNMIVRKSVSNISRHLSPSSSPSQHRPNFVPWDRERFLERLETFRRVDRWSPKPAPINEVQWAKRGWSCVDVMRVECVGGCGCSVVVKLPEDVDVDGDEEDDDDKFIERREVQARLVEEYSKRITDGHAERCPWRKSGCDDTIQRLTLTNPETAVKSLQKRYVNLTFLESKLPPMENIAKPDGLDLDDIAKMLPPTFLSFTQHDKTGDATQARPEQPADAQGNQDGGLPQVREKITTAALVLAIFGWDASGEAGADLASCRACFRRLGLWMYKPKEDGSIPVYDKLDVVSEHMDYCPWINSKTQSGGRKPVFHGPSGKPQSGWEIVDQAIKTMHRRRTRCDAPSTGQGTPSNLEPANVDDEGESRQLQDREWWAKLRRVRQSLLVKGPKKPK